MKTSMLIASVSLATLCLGLASPAAASELPPPTYDRANDNPVLKTDGKRTARNAVYLELLGNGGLYSINYERALMDNVMARVGFSYFSIGASATDGSGQDASAKVTLMTAPVMANYLLGGGGHSFELGAGALVVYAGGEAESGGLSASANGVGVAGTATAGYRYQPLDGGFLFKVGFTPLVTDSGFTPWGGLSLGGTF